MQNYSVVSKGIYKHEQTSDLLKIERFLIVRKKRRRFLLLDMCNESNETLTAVKLEVEQFDVRGNSLGTAVGEFKKLSHKNGSFILKNTIGLHSSCIDFRVKVVYAEYGNYVYRLGEEGTYVTYEKKKTRQKLDAYTVRKKTGKEGFVSAPRRFKIPVFVSVFASMILALSAVFAVGHVFWFKETADEFFLSNLKYTYASEDRSEDAPVYITGYIGQAGKNITIPNTVEGHPVTGIADYAFADNDIITTLTVEEGVTVSAHAFQNCENLSSVTLQGKNVVNDYAFAYCNNLSEISAVDLVEIGNHAFGGIYTISSLRITSTSADEATLRIAYDAFSGCNNFGEIYLDDFIYYMSGSEYFPDAHSVEKLYLKNFNYSDYAEAQTDFRLRSVFGGNEVDVTTLEIGYMDSIPANLMEGCEDELTSFTVKYLKNTTVGAYAFNDCKKLKTVSIPALLTEVGAYAFSNTDIESFDARALTLMGDGAFANCDELASFNLSANNKLASIPAFAFDSCNSLTAMILPNSVAWIGESAFEDCDKLNSVLFQDNEMLTAIGDKAFEGCVSLYSMVIPEAVASIGSKAFYECKNLHYISLPKALTSISSNTFNKCYKLFEIQNLSEVSITAGTGLGKYTLKVYNTAEEQRIPKESVDGFNFAQIEDTWVLLEYTGSEKEIVTPEYINGEPYLAWSYMFIEDTNVEKIQFSAGAVQFGVEMFKDSSVKEIVFNGNTPLGWMVDTFEDATGVITLDFGSREFTEVPANAFSTLTNLKDITLPESVTTIRASAFENSQSLENVYGCEGVITIEENAFNACGNLKSYAFGSALKTISPYAFYDCYSLKSVTGAIRLETIGNNAFENCAKLESVMFANTLLTIGESAFRACSRLSGIEGGRSLVSIENSAFRECSSLQSVSLPSTLIYLGSYAYYGCRSLRSVGISDALVSIYDNTFAECTSLRSVSGGGGLETIGSEAFYNCTSLSSYNIPSSVQTIEANAFRNCTSLNNVNAGNNLQSIGESAFADCTNLKSFSFNTLLQSIGAYAFNNCTSLSAVNLPSYLQSVGEYAFQNCSSMSTLTTDENLQMIGDYAFADCTSLYTLNLSEGLTTIGSYAFYNCTSLSDVVLPSTLSNLGASAFQQCTGMTSLSMISGSLYAISDYAFADCTSLSYVDFADAATLIGSYAFSNCSSLQVADLPLNVMEISYGAFMNCTSLETVWLYAGLNYIYSDAFEGCNKLHEVYNLSNLSIVKDRTNYGKVAYNAVVVHNNGGSSLYRATVGNYVFKYTSDGSVWALVDYTGSASELTLDDMRVSGYTVDGYEIARYAFEDCTTLKKLTIGGAVSNIRTYAFTGVNNLQSVTFTEPSLGTLGNYVFTDCSNLTYIVIPTTLAGFSSYTFDGGYGYNAYYEGSRDVFYNNDGYSRYSISWYATFYYYDACIHYSNEWNYDGNGSINTEIKALDVETVIQAATCTSNGSKTYSCRTCADTETETLWSLGHDYEDSECIRCGYVNNMRVTGNNFEHAQEFLSFSNDATNPFDLFEKSSNYIYSTAGRNSVSTLTITAKADLNVSFDARCEGAEAQMIISVNGMEYALTDDWNSYYFSLTKGMSITIQYIDLREPLPEAPVEDETTSDTSASESSTSEESSESADVLEDVTQIACLYNIRLTSMYEPV